jgi:hypothetical protein
MTREVYFVNSEAHKFYMNIRIITYDLEGNLVSYYPDIGTSIYLINRHIIDTHYPNIPRQMSKDIINLLGVSDGLAITLFARIPVRFLIMDREIVEFIAKAYIVDEL